MKKFAVSIWDALFGESEVMEIPNISGEIVRRSVTRKWLEMVQNKVDTETGDLYVIHYFEDEEPKIEMLTKEQWHIAHRKLEALSSS